MPKINTPFFIASRLSAEKSTPKNKVMVDIATLSVTVSIAVMIVAIAVIVGFKKEIAAKVVGFSSHIQIVNLDNNNSYETVPVSADQPFLAPLRELSGVVSVNEYAVKAGVMRHNDAIQGVVLKGVSSGFDWAFFKENLVTGSVPLIVDSVKTKEVLISSSLASLMQLQPGDKFEMMFIEEPPRRDRYTVSGIYETSLAEFDKIMVIADIRNIQRLNRWDTAFVTGFDIMIEDFDELEKVKEEVENIVFELQSPEQPLMVVDVKERNEAIFDWLSLQDLNVVIIIAIMIFVSGFNMIAMVLILLMEKTSLIGILKTLGMPDSQLQKLFLYRASYITIKGVVLGNIVGIGLCLLQHYTGLVKLSEAGYFLTEVPVYINWFYIVLLDVGAFAAILLLQALPTLIIARISADKNIKYS